MIVSTFRSDSPAPCAAPRARQRAARAFVALTLAAAGLAGTAAHAAVALAPQWGGSFALGEGADASFQRIDNAWQGSSVLWDEASRSFGSGAPIGSFSWGTGLWGQADWLSVQQSAAGAGDAQAPAILQSWLGIVGQVNHGNSRYGECYSSTWGAAELVPFFSPSPALGDCADGAAGDPAQQNWTARYSGFIRISDPGEYNFSVLHDDGFFLRLVGAGGAEQAIGRNYLNPRERVAFDDNLMLGSGLYGFELGVWNRLGAGVADLRWAQSCVRDCDWELVPTSHLVSASKVPAPSGLALALGALAALTWVRRRAAVSRT